MAENLMNMNTRDYWGLYGNTTLHTNYNYFRENIYFTKNIKSVLPASFLKLSDDIDRLKNSEMKLYNTFGVSSYEDFMSIVRKLMAGPDGRVIARFTNEALLQTIIKDITRDAENHANVGKTELTLYINAKDANKKIKEINKMLDTIADASDKGSKLSSKTVIVNNSDGRIGLSFKVNPQIMKVIINRLKSTRFHPSKLNSDMLSDYLEDTFLEEITFEKDGKALDRKELSSEIKYRPFPWGYRNSEIKKAWENPSTRYMVENELDKAVYTIREHIINMG